MKLLVDTQCFLWWREGNSRLGRKARAAIEREASEVRVSTASAWEIAIKVQSGRLPFRERLAVWLPAAIQSSGFRVLLITLEHAVAVAELPEHHGDPFDRLLIAQAQLENLTIVTSDMAFDAYDIKVLDARR